MITLELSRDEAKSLSIALTCFIEDKWENSEAEMQDGHLDCVSNLVDVHRILKAVDEILRESLDES